MKLVKRLAAAVIALAVAAPCAVFATESAEALVFYDVDTSSVSYSVETDANVASVVVRDTATSDVVAHVEQLYGTGEKVAHVFRMPGTAPSGEYELSIVPDNSEEISTYFRHINAEQADAIVSAISDATDPAVVESLIANDTDGDLGIDNGYFMIESAEIAGFLTKLKKADMTAEDFWKDYHYAETLSITKGESVSNILNTITGYERAMLLGIDVDAFTKSVADGGYSENVKKAVAERFKKAEFDAGCDFKEKVKEWVALARLNDAQSVAAYQEILLTEYPSVFVLDAGAKSKYDASSYKEDIIRDMMDTDYTTKGDAVAAFKTQAEKKRGSGGGGGSDDGGYPDERDDGNESGTVIIPPDPSLIQGRHLSDIGGQWAGTIINDLYNKGIVNGSDNKFYPNNNITRAEFCTLISQAFYKGQTGSTASFGDVTPDNWYYSYVGLLNAKGIVSGMGDGTFGAGRNITRQDMAAIIARCMNDLKKSTEATRDMAEFTDAAEIASYSAEAIEMLYTSGVISGYEDGSFKPTANLTKAEAATVIFKLLNK